MDRLDELSVFLAILETGSLAAAARRLRRSPPAVTRILAALEDRVGARLIERNTRKLAPTEAGRRLADDARRIVGAYEAAIEREDSGPLRGALRVTAPVVFGARHIAPIVQRFLDAHPLVTAELVLNDRNLDLVDEAFDLALRIGALADSALVARRVGEVRRVLVASPAYLAARGAPQRPSDLGGHEVVSSTAVREGADEWRFQGPAGVEAVRVRPRISINGIEPCLAVVLAGRGLARPLTYQVADELADGRLVRLLQAYEPPPIPVHLVTPSARLTPPRVRAFLDLAAAELSVLPVIHA